MTQLADVIWAVQMSTVEFHPWNSRRADTEQPDEWRIDLDPMPDCASTRVRRVAHVAHEVLDELGITGYPKTSGGRGPARLRPDRARAGASATSAGRRWRSPARWSAAPSDVTTTWWRKDRDPAKLFVDYNQNARDHTIASAYSVRGNQRGTVSTPITLGRDRRRRAARLHHPDRAGPLRRAGRPARRIDDTASAWTRCCEWAARDEQAGLAGPADPE